MKQVKQLLRYPVVLVFFLFLFGYTLFDLTQTDREYSEFENKYLAQKPPFTMKAFLNNEWTQDYEEYINDQFVLRDDWITLKSVCESMLLKIENNGIAYGEDGYMFEKFTTLSGDQRAQYDRNLGYAMTFLNNHQNDNVTFAIIPNAYAIMPEKLPAGLEQIDQLALIQEAYAQAPESAGIVDFSGTLPEHKDEYIYYRTDHHWTVTGAYYAYVAFCKEAGFTPTPYDSFEWNRKEPFYGTLYSQTQDSTLRENPDYVDYPTISTPHQAYMYKRGEPFTPYASTIMADYASGVNMYSVFLHGDQPLTEIQTENKNGRKAVVVKESFGNAFSPFLVAHYETVYIVDQRYFELNLPDFIKQNGVTDLIFINNVFAANTAVQIQWIQGLMTQQWAPPVQEETEESEEETESSQEPEDGEEDADRDKDSSEDEEDEDRRKKDQNDEDEE